MADLIQNTQQEFWRSPTLINPLAESTLPASAAPVSSEMAEACADCGTEFMIGARFCHACGLNRPMIAMRNSDSSAYPTPWDRGFTWSLTKVRSTSAMLGAACRKVSFPTWMRYLHFHEIQRAIGLATAPLIAFLIGLGCIAGAIGVSLFYHASNLGEFQAIQMWRVEWLLAATASFVAGILLKKPSGE